MNIREQFSKLFLDFNIDNNISDDEFNELIKPLIDFLKLNIPNEMYKFREITKYSINAFKSGDIWLSNVLQFNDVHDTLTYINKELIKEKISNLNVQFIKHLKQNENYTIETKTNNIKIKKDIKSLRNLLSQMNTKQIIDCMNEEWFWKEIIDRQLNDFNNIFRKQIRTICFSENIKSPLMWAHYSDYHRGFALSYNFKDKLFDKANANESKYINLKGGVYIQLYIQKKDLMQQM